jgi:mycofactocin precursor
VTTTDQTAVPRAAEATPDRSTDRDEAPEALDEPALVEDELLVEDVSIDGMCGVY